MPAYARKSTIEHEFGARRVPDGVIVCNGCNGNMADLGANPSGTVYVLYIDKAHLKANIPHDVYCESCLKSGFPGAKIV